MARPGAPSQRTAAEVRCIEQAAAWYARLCSGSATEADRGDWERWRTGHPSHAAAWARIEAMQRLIGTVPGALAAPALGAAVRMEEQTRRSVLRTAVVGLGTASVAWWGWRQPMRQELMADMRTGVGQQRELQLSDGSQLALNTRTAVDVAFDTGQRLLRLRAGEILVQTAPDPLAGVGAQARPFLVQTAHGTIRALGTRFMVRTDEQATQVTVLDKAVEIQAVEAAPAVPLRLQAGQQLRFGPGQTGPFMASPADPAAAAWRQGSVLAEDMPLAQLLAELGRYRVGVLSCDPAIADMRVSGAFPVPDTDRALTVLVHGLPVRLHSRTRWWVRVEPR